MIVSRKKVARLLALAVVCACTLLAALVVEFAVRIALPYCDPRACFVSKPQVTGEESPTEFDYKRFWKLRANLKDHSSTGTLITTNSRGLRLDYELEPKQPDTIRIVCMGDSVTFGYGVPLEPERGVAPYYALLEKKLRERHPDWHWEVIPLACPGYTTAQGRFWLEEMIGELEPDVLTGLFGWNDGCSSFASNNQIGMRSHFARGVRWFSSHSQAFTHALHWRLDNFKYTRPDWFRLPRSTVEDYLLDHHFFVQEMKRRGGEYFAILPIIANVHEDVHEGFAIRAFRAMLAEYCKNNDVNSLLVPELTEACWPDNAFLFQDERIHPNEVGEALIAERMYPAILPTIDRITHKRRERLNEELDKKIGK